MSDKVFYTWAPDPESDGSPASVESAVFQALGAASVCWSNMSSDTGVFESERAKAIGDGLLEFLRHQPQTHWRPGASDVAGMQVRPTRTPSA